MVNGTLDELLNEYANIEYPKELHNVAENLSSIRSMLNRCINIFADKNDKEFQSYFARNVVDMACELFIGYRMLKLSTKDERKRIVTRFFVEKTFANALKLSDPIIKGNTTAITNREEICLI